MRIVTCPNCGAKVSDQYSFCSQCNAPLNEREFEILENKEKKEKPIAETAATSVPSDIQSWLLAPLREKERVEKQYCANCKAEIVVKTKFCPSCGQPLTISVVHVLSSSLSIMKKKPVILLPFFLEQVVIGLPVLWFLYSLPRGGGLVTLEQSLMRLLPTLLWLIPLAFILRIIVDAMYPLMVRNVLVGRKVDLVEAFRKVVRRFSSLFIASILVNLQVVIGLLLLVVPGVYFAAGYYCTFPAIMLEERGARVGMAASMSFSRNRKWKTLALILIASIPAAFGSEILGFLGRPVFLGVAFTLTINVFSYVLRDVMSSYTYIKYGMEKF